MPTALWNGIDDEQSISMQRSSGMIRASAASVELGSQPTRGSQASQGAQMSMTRSSFIPARRHAIRVTSFESLFPGGLTLFDDAAPRRHENGEEKLKHAWSRLPSRSSQPMSTSRNIS